MFEAYSSIDILENATANGHVATWLWWRWKSLARGGAKACSLMSGIRDSMFCLYLGNEIFLAARPWTQAKVIVTIHRKS